MKQLLLLLLVSFFVHPVFSQSDKAIAHQLGFEYFAIKDTFRASTEDSIRFIVSKDREDKPFLLFIQGSGNASLIERTSPGGYFQLLENLMSDSMKNSYRVILLSKPGIPLVTDSAQTNAVFYSKTRGTFLRFVQNDYLDYYVSASRQVIDFVKKELPFDTKLFVVGHSQGYPVAAKLAARFPGHIDKVVCMSSNPFGQHYCQEVQKIRQQELLNRISSNEAQAKINSVYQQFNDVRTGFTQFGPGASDENFCLYRNDVSFNCEMAIDNLLAMQCPLLVVYGSSDIASVNNDLLPFFFARSGRNNLTLKCFPGYDHNYFHTEPATDGKSVRKECCWPLVFDNVDVWLKTGQ